MKVFGFVELFFVNCPLYTMCIAVYFSREFCINSSFMRTYEHIKLCMEHCYICRVKSFRIKANNVRKMRMVSPETTSTRPLHARQTIHWPTSVTWPPFSRYSR